MSTSNAQWGSRGARNATGGNGGGGAAVSSGSFRGGGHRHDRGGSASSRGGRRGSGGGHGASAGVELGRSGSLVCDYSIDAEAQRRCTWRTNSDTAMRLHRADRHLLMPPGGAQELERIDPMLEEERREKARRARRAGQGDEAEEQANLLVSGLNIKLDTPELIAKWVAERKRRWPTTAVVEQKALHSWDKPVQASARAPARAVTARTEVVEEKGDGSSTSSESDSDDDGPPEEIAITRNQEDASLSGSDVDEERDAVSSKVEPPAAIATTERQRCRFFQRGACRNGDACSHRHEIGILPTTKHYDANGTKRKRPRAPSPNPFEAPHLLRALLRNEIAQHVNYVAQVVRFIVRNEFLVGYERKQGDAAEQARRRNLVVDVTEGSKEKEGDVNGQPVSDETTNQPLVKGALPLLGKSLYHPKSPTLKPLDSLSLPPEPDEFALMDPLRAHDAKPLTHEQCRQVAQDAGIRALLIDDGQEDACKGIVRALNTLDALPSYAHRASALELMLGVSEQSVQHAHQLGSTYVRSDRQPTNTGSGSGGSSSSRVIGESELFRLGLRVGATEIAKIRRLASRVSSVIGGPAFEDDDADAQQPWIDAKTRHDMQVRQWQREGEWRDQMRKLGVEVD